MSAIWAASTIWCLKPWAKASKFQFTPGLDPVYNHSINPAEDTMKVRVHFWSGTSQDFVVPEDILFIDFTNMAFEAGGKIRHLEFL